MFSFTIEVIIMIVIVISTMLALIIHNIQLTNQVMELDGELEEVASNEDRMWMAIEELSASGVLVSRVTTDIYMPICVSHEDVAVDHTDGYSTIECNCGERFRTLNAHLKHKLDLFNEKMNSSYNGW